MIVSTKNRARSAQSFLLIALIMIASSNQSLYGMYREVLYTTPASEDHTLRNIVIAGAVGYAGYKVYNHISFKNAQSRLAKHQEIAKNVIRNHQTRLNDELICQQYTDSRTSFDILCSDGSADIKALEEAQNATHTDMSSWYNKPDFWRQAKTFTEQNQQDIAVISGRVEFLVSRKALLTLAHLLATEKDARWFRLVDAHTQNALTSQLVSSMYHESTYPRRQAFNDIRARQSLYEGALLKVQNYTNHSNKSLQIQNSAATTESHLKTAQNVIASWPEYTEDLKTEKAELSQQEALHIEREKAAAALRAAQAAEREAQAREEANLQRDRAQLMALRSQLNTIKEDIERAQRKHKPTSHLTTQRFQLQNEIRTLKTKVEGNPSTLRVLAELFLDID